MTKSAMTHSIRWSDTAVLLQSRLCILGTIERTSEAQLHTTLEGSIRPFARKSANNDNGHQVCSQQQTTFVSRTHPLKSLVIERRKQCEKDEQGNIKGQLPRGARRAVLHQVESGNDYISCYWRGLAPIKGASIFYANHMQLHGMQTIPSFRTNANPSSYKGCTLDKYLTGGCTVIVIE